MFCECIMSKFFLFDSEMGLFLVGSCLKKIVYKSFKKDVKIVVKG